MDVTDKHPGMTPFPPGKEFSLLPAGYMAGWTPESVWTIWGGRNLVSLLRIEPRFLGTPGHGVVIITNWNIPALK